MPGNLNRESSPAVARASNGGAGGGGGDSSSHASPSPRNSVVGNGNTPHNNTNGSSNAGNPKVTSGFKSSNGDHHSKGLSPARMVADGGGAGGSPIRDSSKLPQFRSTVSPSGRRSSPSAAAAGSASSGRPPLSSRSSSGGGGQSGARSGPRDIVNKRVSSAAASSASPGGCSPGGHGSPVTAGRTPLTRRKDLAAASGSTPGSPVVGGGAATGYSPGGSPSRPARSSLTDRPKRPSGQNGQSGHNGPKKPRPLRTSQTNSPHQQIQQQPQSNHHPPLPPPHTVVTPPAEDTAAEALSPEEAEQRRKFEEIWDAKTIEQGKVIVPTERLEALIHKDNIEKYFRIQEKPVASGLCATVRKCTHKETGLEYAAKFSSRMRSGPDCSLRDCSMDILHEIAMLAVCNDANKIVHLRDVFHNKHEIILVLEYAPYGDFQSILEDDMVPFEQDVVNFLKQILEALGFIHERNIAHMDLKAENVVLMGSFPNCEIKLCDMESARVIQEDEHIREVIGTPDYVAPEILGLEPISLAADIWSLGVLAYVLLTGFTPFGGDTDQETLRNITTPNLQVDFPQELFEGVSDMAKDFIRVCLNRNPRERPTVQELLQHPLLAEEEEPPSPSPLMLKIPTAPVAVITGDKGHGLLDKHAGPASPTGHHRHGHANGPSFNGPSSLSASRRSCQTCRNTATERKRYLSKSREAIFEKVSRNSNLKKSLSKSRERLCDMRLAINKSRENLHSHSNGNSGGPPRKTSRDETAFKQSLSRSQEVLSNALGMKRVNGTVSDISHALTTGYAAGSAALNATASESDLNEDDFVLLPGTNELLVFNLHRNCADEKRAGILSEPLVEVEERENEAPPPAGGQPQQEQTTELRAKSKSREPSPTTKTAAVDAKPDSRDFGMQVDMPALLRELEEIRRLEEEVRLRQNCEEVLKAVPCAVRSANAVEDETKNATRCEERRRSASQPPMFPTAAVVTATAGAPLRSERAESTSSSGGGSESGGGPFRHSSTLGSEAENGLKKGKAWRTEVAKFQLQKRVSQLIETFDGSREGSAEPQETTTTKGDDGDEALSELKQNRQRRGSLQILNVDTAEEEEETAPTKRKSDHAKQLRRKSTSAIALSSMAHNGDMNILGLTDILMESASVVSSGENPGEKEQQQSRNSDSQGRIAAKKWAYFEMEIGDHPKAISDKKLMQLKSKYQRRNTEPTAMSAPEGKLEDLKSKRYRKGSILQSKSESVEEEDTKPRPTTDQSQVEETPIPPDNDQQNEGEAVKAISIEAGGDMDQSLIDPSSSSCDSGATSNSGTEDSSSSSSSSRKSSRSSPIRRKSSNVLPDIAESSAKAAVDCEAKKGKKDKTKELKVNVSLLANDDGIGSLPHTPTNSNGPLQREDGSAPPATRLDDGIFTSSEEGLPTTAATAAPSDKSSETTGSDIAKALEKLESINNNDNEE